MIVRIEPGQRMREDDSALVVGPEKGFLIVGAGGNVAASRDAVRQARARAKRNSVPHGRATDVGAGADVGEAQDALRDVESSGLLAGEDAPAVVENSAPPGEGSPARERFERRAEEIARAAEIGVRALMEDEAKLLAPLVQDRLPEVGDERRFPGRDASQQPRREDTDPRVEERAWAVDAERRDSIPFGLKRRVVLRVPVFRDEERRRATRGAMPREEGIEVDVDRGIGVDDEEVVLPEEIGRVAQGPGRSEDSRLREEAEVRKLRRLLAQLALDLIAQMMEINRYFADAGLVQAPQVCHREGNVEEG